MPNRLRRWKLYLLALLWLAPLLRAQQPAQPVPPELISYPDTILYNGKIAILNDASLTSALGRTVQAIAIRGDRIQFIGTDDEILRYAGPSTRKMDLKGRTVLPGLAATGPQMKFQFQMPPRDRSEGSGGVRMGD